MSAFASLADGYHGFFSLSLLKSKGGRDFQALLWSSPKDARVDFEATQCQP